MTTSPDSAFAYKNVAKISLMSIMANLLRKYSIVTNFNASYNVNQDKGKMNPNLLQFSQGMWYAQAIQRKHGY